MYGIYNDLQAAGSDPFAIAPIIYAAERCVHDELHPQTKAKLRELRSAFENGEITPQWVTESYQCLSNVIQISMGQPVEGKQLTSNQRDHFSLGYENEYNSAQMEYRSMDHRVTAGLREELAHAHTAEELQVIVHSLHDAATKQPYAAVISVNDDEALGGFEIGLNRTLNDKEKEKEHQVSVLGSNGMITTAHLPKESQSQMMRERILAICDKLDADPKGNVLFGAQYNASRKGFMDSFHPDLTAAGEVSKQLEEDLGEKQRSVQDIYSKMKAEKGVHINSAKYKEMLACAKKVSEMKYDPNSLESVNEMKKAMLELNHAAEEYARDKVYDKTKKTERGVARKNTALALMELSVPGSTAMDARRVKDLRSAKGEKNRTSLAELIQAEVRESKSTYRKTQSTPSDRVVRGKSRSAYTAEKTTKPDMMDPTSRPGGLRRKKAGPSAPTM